jgi:hypothetical protein
MQFVVIKQIAVEAETPEEAVAKIDEGSTISLQVQLRIQSQVTRTVVGQSSTPQQSPQ